MLFKLQQRVKMLYIIKNLSEGYLMFNEDIRSKKALQHKKYTINRCTFILMFFMINLTIDLYYYYEYVNMYLVCTYNMTRMHFLYKATHEMCHANYNTWLCIYIFLININVNKRETLIKQIGYSQVSYEIYRTKYLPVGKTTDTFISSLNII
jgi:hypothetical protein